MTIDAVGITVTDMRDQVHSGCVVCSFANTNGLHLKFDVAQDGSVKADFHCDTSFEGYPGRLHGGVISSILDGAMGNCMFARNKATVTVELTIRFKCPIITGHQATVLARVTRDSHPLYLLEAEIVQNNQIKATAKGKYYDQPELINMD